MRNLKFDVQVLNRLFPFFFTVGEQGQLTEAGPSFRKLIGPIGPLPSFDEIFKVTRPAGISFQNLRNSQDGEMITLQMQNPKAQFMGQIIPLPDSENRLFIINLSVQDADELTNLKLDFTDFAIQDPIFDYLMLLQTQRRAIRQADEANKKLTVAHQIALAASQTKSLFLANMSHELRTPMNGLLGMASILQDTNLDEDQKDYVQTLISSGEAMLALVNDILDLSKIEAGHIELSLTPVYLKELVKDIHDTVYPLAKKKNLLLDFSIEDTVPEVLSADRIRLRQVILNLIGNAVKFTAKGFVTLSLSAKELPDGRCGLHFLIKDSGIGMSPGTLEKIFSPFVQGDSSMTKKFEGTGLGLSICKKLVDAMDGKIEVKSTEGQGTEFQVDVCLDR